MRGEDQHSPLSSFFGDDYLFGPDQYNQSPHPAVASSVTIPAPMYTSGSLDPLAPENASLPESPDTALHQHSPIATTPMALPGVAPGTTSGPSGTPLVRSSGGSTTGTQVSIATRPEGSRQITSGNTQIPSPHHKLVEIKRTTDVKSRACNECRKRKTACYYLEGNSEKCFRCQMEDADCTFTEEPKPAKPAQARPLAPAGSRGHPPLVAGSTLGTGPLEDYSVLPGRSLLKKTLSLQHPRSSFAINEFGLWDKRVLQSVPLDKSGQARVSANLSLRKIADDCLFMVRNDGGQADWIRDCDEIEKIVAPYGRLLVNCYFLWCQQSYPVLHEKIFVEKYTRTYRELTPALLGAVYLQAFKYWYRSPELSTVARPGQLAPVLYDLTTTAFFKMSGGSSLSLIQAGLLLLQSSYADGRHLAISSVITMTAYRLALNRSCEHWKLPRWEINLRIRISWAVYSQATWISLIESIPSLIPGDPGMWHLSAITPNTFETGGMAPPSSASFIQLMHLSAIVREIHRLLSSPRESPVESGLTMEHVLTEVKPVQIRLRQWHHDLPEQLSGASSSQPSFALHVAYIAAEVSLHRFIIRNLTTFQSAGRNVDADLVQVCRSSARDRLEAAMDLVSALRPHHLQSFWYFVSSYHFAIVGLFAALMYTTSDAREEAEYYKERLRNYVGLLEAYSEADVMGAAVRTLRSSIAGVPGLELLTAL